jgi:hypothetical protein
MSPSTDQVTAYYRAARAALHYVEARRPGGRRFGPDADARWRAFAGGLTASARLDLLISDANTEWPGAFAARTAFDLDQVAEDDAFGAQWQPLDPVLAEELWREPPPIIGSPRAALAAVAGAWALRLSTLAIPALDPAQKVWVAGPTAIASLAEHFASARDLDWAAQVTCVATPPAHRQLAAFAAALTDAPRPAVVICAANASAPPATALTLVSDDADPVDRAVVQRGGAR